MLDLGASSAATNRGSIGHRSFVCRQRTRRRQTAEAGVRRIERQTAMRCCITHISQYGNPGKVSTLGGRAESHRRLDTSLVGTRRQTPAAGQQAAARRPRCSGTACSCLLQPGAVALRLRSQRHSPCSGWQSLLRIRSWAGDAGRAPTLGAYTGRCRKVCCLHRPARARAHLRSRSRGRQWPARRR